MSLSASITLGPLCVQIDTEERYAPDLLDDLLKQLSKSFVTAVLAARDSGVLVATEKEPEDE